ncbi:MAG: hypothetical protein ACREOW_13740 [Thermodesulfobacteriota bacterium]
MTKESKVEYNRDPKQTTYTHDLLGYAPIKNIKYTETQYYEGELVNSSNFTVDENGLRITPFPKSSSVKGDVIFFGCSYTYGAGVNDSETMPYQVGLMSKRNYRIYNFGYLGYGPHQMLSAIENGILENIVGHDDKPKILIYQAIFGHIKRSTGRPPLDDHGPRYKLVQNGEVFYSGHFDDNHIIPQSVKQKLINKFLIYKKIVQSDKSLRARDVDLFLGIVNASKKRFEDLYPRSKFYMIWWDSPGKEFKEHNEKILNALKRMQIKVYLISDILPDYENNKSTYQLNPHDTHPNALAHKIIAKHIIDNILDEYSHIK